MSSIDEANDQRLDSHDFLGEFAFHGNERQRITQVGERASISPWVRQLVFRRDNWQCQICGSSPVAADAHRRSGALHLDHIRPWSAGGSDRTDNLRTLCHRCNTRRGNSVDKNDRPALPIIRACVPCLSGSRFGARDITDPLEVWCACCRRRSVSFRSVAII